ncbi:MAG: TlpA family protein disulfide reductase [Cytophagaceae bacterium]|nr:MAG: TlpA family protein disulfide reductase [Cytophagaceae bacterium]
MKIHWSAGIVLALVPACALAQNSAPHTSNSDPQKVKADFSIAPVAKAIMERATASYKDARGISLKSANTSDGKDKGQSSLRFARPNLLFFERQVDEGMLRLLMTGHDLYIGVDASYSKMPQPPDGISQIISAAGLSSGQMIGAMLEGKSPSDILKSNYSSLQFKGLKSKTIALPPRMIDGQMLSGIQNTKSFGVKQINGTFSVSTQQLTAWFGGSPFLLRRTQSQGLLNGKRFTFSERLFDQQLNPTLAEDTFKFNATGLKPMQGGLLGGGGGSEQYFDSRLKVGAKPFTFTAKGLNGKAISLSNYKGKVVLMDFWATWCGPCVAGLPELKSAYDKYHSKGLEVVGISLDEDKKALTSFIKARKMPWPQIFDGKGWKSAVPGVYGVKAIPFLLLIGKDGKIAAVNPRGEIDKAVKAALAKG